MLVVVQLVALEGEEGAGADAGDEVWEHTYRKAQQRQHQWRSVRQAELESDVLVV